MLRTIITTASFTRRRYTHSLVSSYYCRFRPYSSLPHQLSIGSKFAKMNFKDVNTSLKVFFFFVFVELVRTYKIIRWAVFRTWKFNLWIQTRLVLLLGWELWYAWRSWGRLYLLFAFRFMIIFLDDYQICSNPLWHVGNVA